jgi:hypothetical protein
MITYLSLIPNSAKKLWKKPRKLRNPAAAAEPAAPIPLPHQPLLHLQHQHHHPLPHRD